VRGYRGADGRRGPAGGGQLVGGRGWGSVRYWARRGPGAISPRDRDGEWLPVGGFVSAGVCPYAGSPRCSRVRGVEGAGTPGGPGGKGPGGPGGKGPGGPGVVTPGRPGWSRGEVPGRPGGPGVVTPGRPGWSRGEVPGGPGVRCRDARGV